MRSIAAAAAIAVAVPALIPADALACSCAAGLVFTQPRYGAEGAPLNATILLGYTYYPAPDAFRLLDADGNLVPVDVSSYQGNGALEITLAPSAGRLRANTTYRVMGDGQEQLSFTTGATADTTPPTLDGIAGFSGGYDDGCTHEGGTVTCDTCGDSTLMAVRYDNPRDDHTAVRDLMYRVFVETGGASPDEESYSYTSPGWPVGESLCTYTFPGLNVGDAVTVRAQVIDEAGNVSPLSDPVTAIVEDDPDNIPTGGCSRSDGTASSQAGETNAAPEAGWLLLGLAGLLGMGLRRR